MVTPFAVLPPVHGGAVRTVRLASALAGHYDVVLLSDEPELHGERADAYPPVFSAVHLVGGRPPEPAGHESDRIARIRSHSHTALKRELERIVAIHRPVAVIVGHVELAGLIETDLVPRPRMLLDLHDVLMRPDEPGQAQADRFESALMRRFDDLLVCSREDQALLDAPSHLVINGYDVPADRAYVPSRGKRSILFVGPFRTAINYRGIREFVERAYPQIEAAVPGVTLTIVGGTGAQSIASSAPCFSRPSIRVVERVDIMRDALDACAITINPQSELRGSSLKVIESVAAGRVCVSTQAGARGWRDVNLSALITLRSVDDFVAPIVRLLLDEDCRTGLELPDPVQLAACSWNAAGAALTQYLDAVVQARQ
jgi:hypothetical protein